MSSNGEGSTTSRKARKNGPDSRHCYSCKQLSCPPTCELRKFKERQSRDAVDSARRKTKTKEKAKFPQIPVEKSSAASPNPHKQSASDFLLKEEDADTVSTETLDLDDLLRFTSHKASLLLNTLWSVTLRQLKSEILSSARLYRQARENQTGDWEFPSAMATAGSSRMAETAGGGTRRVGPCGLRGGSRFCHKACSCCVEQQRESLDGNIGKGKQNLK